MGGGGVSQVKAALSAIGRCRGYRSYTVANRGLMPKGLRRTKNPTRSKNLLRVVFLVRRGDLLSRRSLCRHDFPGNYRHFSSSRRVHGVVNLGGVVKTLLRSNSLFFLSS